MNWKIVVLGGLAFYLATWIPSFATGPLIHEGVLKDTYIANSQFWQPALNQDPPDMASLMPRWIAFGLFGAFVFAGFFALIRPALSGPGWKKGLVFGFCLALVQCATMGGWSGIFNLPANIWIWWAVEGFAYYLFGGAVLGWVAQKLVPEA